jgi:hypothetical protein
MLSIGRIECVFVDAHPMVVSAAASAIREIKESIAAE